MPQADGVAELVRDQVARDVRQPGPRCVQRVDADHAPAVGVERPGEGDEAAAREQHGQVAGEAAQRLRHLEGPGGAEDRGAHILQRLFRDRHIGARRGGKPEGAADLLEHPVPVDDGLVDQREARVALGADDDDGRLLAPPHLELRMGALQSERCDDGGEKGGAHYTR